MTKKQLTEMIRKIINEEQQSFIIPASSNIGRDPKHKKFLDHIVKKANDPTTKNSELVILHKKLSKIVPAHDTFWIRWNNILFNKGIGLI